MSCKLDKTCLLGGAYQVDKLMGPRKTQEIRAYTWLEFVVYIYKKKFICLRLC